MADQVEKTVILKTDEILVVVLLLPKSVMLLGGKYLFLLFNPILKIHVPTDFHDYLEQPKSNMDRIVNKTFSSSRPRNDRANERFRCTRNMMFIRGILR